MDCLFKDVASCGQIESSEHLSPSCLGGARESTDVLCSDCNHYFGEDVDPALGDLYRPIMLQLSPFMPRRARDKSLLAQSLIEGTSMVLGGGGVANLGKIRKTFDSDGNPVEIIGHVGTRTQLELIVSKYGADPRRFRFVDVPLTEAIAEPKVRSIRQFDIWVHMRATAKVLLENLDFYSREKHSKSFARHQGLLALRRFARNGQEPNWMTRTTSPFRPREIAESWGWGSSGSGLLMS